MLSVESSVYSIISLPTLLTNLFYLPPKPQLYTSLKNLKNLQTHTRTVINETTNIRHEYNHGADIYTYNIISVKLMIFLLLPIYIFFNLNSLQNSYIQFHSTRLYNHVTWSNNFGFIKKSQSRNFLYLLLMSVYIQN